MSVDTLITIGLGLAAASYVAVLVRRSTRKFLVASKQAAGSACGGCSGCGTPDGHADSEESCTANEGLIELGKKTV